MQDYFINFNAFIFWAFVWCSPAIFFLGIFFYGHQYYINRYQHWIGKVANFTLAICSATWWLKQAWLLQTNGYEFSTAVTQAKYHYTALVIIWALIWIVGCLIASAYLYKRQLDKRIRQMHAMQDAMEMEIRRRSIVRAQLLVRSDAGDVIRIASANSIYRHINDLITTYVETLEDSAANPKYKTHAVLLLDGIRNIIFRDWQLRHTSSIRWLGGSDKYNNLRHLYL